MKGENRMIKNIVFDLGGVLVDFKPQVFLEHIGFSKEETELFYKLVFCGEEWYQYNSSLLNATETRNELMKHYPEYKDQIKKIFDEIDYNYILFEKKEEMELLKRLKKDGFNIYILSDLSEDHISFYTNLDFFNYIDGGVYSFEVGSIKPNRNNYQTLLNRFDLIAEETIFIDDKLINVEGAKELGIIGIQFLSLEKLQQDLKKYLPLKTL